MQDADKADTSAQMLRISGNLKQCGGAGLEQESKQNPLVLPDQRHQSMGNAEDQVIIADRKQFALTGAEPLFAGAGLTLWTVTIPAGAVRGGFVAAANASIAMSAERCGSATLDSDEYFQLSPGQ